MLDKISKAASVLVAIFVLVYFIMGLVYDSQKGVDPGEVLGFLMLLAWLTLTLGLIWRGDEFGTFHWVATTTQAPGWLMKLLGWMLLVGFPILVYLSLGW